jgi:chorismate dehydratase
VTENHAHLPRIAASSYLNTAPLIWSFMHGRGKRAVRLLTDTAPAKCADMLARDEVEAALVPVIEYQRIPEVVAVPDVCVGSRSEVRSVILATPCAALKEIKRVALDSESRTASALVRIIFREFLGFEPEWTISEPDLQSMLGHSDAALLIGDPAMTVSTEHLQVYDLAGLWRKYTGLGFVFAIWMVRESSNCLQTIDFAGAREEGLEHLQEIAVAYEPILGLPRLELVMYLRENITFTLNAEMLAGLDLFYQLARKHGMIERIRPLALISA